MTWVTSGIECTIVSHFTLLLFLSALFQAGLSIHDCLALIFQTCPGKCAELQPCVQCQQFQSGVLCEGHDECGIDEPGINLCDHEKCGFTVIEVSWY